jgi:hypothetical protein
MANDFKPTVGTKITKKEADDWSKKYKDDKKTDTDSVFLGRDAIQTILNDTRASGISFMFVRKYHEGLKKDVNDLVMVGTTEDGTLLWDGPSGSTVNPMNTDSQTYDGGTICPPSCPK